MTKWEDFKWEVRWYYRNYILGPIYAVGQGVKNIRFYGKTLWQHRWYDYGFQLTMIDKMLEDCENHWSTDTNYVGDKFTLGRIRVIRKYIARYRDTADIYEEDFLFKKVMKLYSKNMTRFWD